MKLRIMELRTARCISSVCLAILLLLASPAFAQVVLPTSVSSWNSTQSKRIFSIPAAAILKEYGLKSGERRTYTHGGETLVATAYSFNDPSGAYGAYSFLRTPDMPQANFTKHSSMSPSRALALTGNLVLEFDGARLDRFHGEIEMLIAQAGGHAEFGTYPVLPDRKSVV